MTTIGDARTHEAFDMTKKCVTLYGAICTITLATVAVVTIGGHMGTTFIWVRAVILLAVAPVLHRLTVRAAQGARRSFERMRTVTTVMPIAVIGIDLIPGICPMWYAVMQAIGVLPLVAVAFILNGSGPRTAFPTTR
ncbi:hypothetical protein GCM10009530_34020 [Microbispora corallina]|uniref:Uncharacterized protein n=1 Tax=Microbispora corallina TaxID=83302 RepID=A0ABQ4G1S2_9ACTN|nr:hypothetical protein [Microbispora corallina]GIH41023.1 hypothetical protein Mco01_40230 [Microbispora corallina]